MRRLWDVAVSLRTTAVLFMAVAALLLLNVVLPQRAQDPAAFAAAVRSGPVARLLLESLGLGDVATSPLFLGALGLFLANLVAVLLDRTGATLRRLRFAPPPPQQWRAILEGNAAAEVEPPGPSREVAAALLDAAGYRTAPVSDGGLWGVKHRLAILGFPVFHASFLVLSLGALQLYRSRDVVSVVAAEGETALASRGAVMRRAPEGGAGEVALRVERVEATLERGFPIDLSARVWLDGGGPPKATRVNHPARWGDLTVLVDRVGIAPVLWVVDPAGYTLDRVVVASANVGGLPTRVRLGRTPLEAVVEPIAVGAGFPERRDLPRVPVTLRLRAGEVTAFEGALRAGQAVTVGDLEVRLEEVRYWVGLRLVRERGGATLIVGFFLAVAGIVWRMVWVRREVAVGWLGDRVVVGVRSEFFAQTARGEAEGIARLLAAGRGQGGRA